MTKVSRRRFLQAGAVGAASAVLVGCQRPGRWETLEPYVRPPEEQLAGVATWYASTCRQCPAGCGIVVRIMNGRALKIEGNPEHPLNQGKLCARGQAGLQVLYNPDRLPSPVQQAQRGTRQYERLSWNEAINTLYAKLQAAGSGVAVWGGSTTSGHLLDLFQRFNQAIGAPEPLIFDLYTAFHGYNLLSTASQDLLGRSALPSYDLGRTDVIFSFGANFTGTWLSATRFGVEYGKFRSQPLGKRGHLVQFEPRMTGTGGTSDLWVPIAPGTEGLIAAALARIIADEGFGSAERIDRARSLAGDVNVGDVIAASEIPGPELVRLAQVFATAERPVAIPGSSLTGQNSADGAARAVQALNLIAGAVGQPGGLTLSHAAPLPDLVQPDPASFSQVQQLIGRMNSGEIQVLLVHGANPAYDLPEAAGFLDALNNVPYVVSFSPLVDETAVHADLILPDRTYLESWGYDVVSPSFDRPVVGSQQPVVTPVFDARSTADVLLTVARGIPAAATALPWADEVAFLQETLTQLPAGANDGVGAQAAMPASSWARFLQHGGWWPAEAPTPAQAPSLPAQPIQVAATQYQGDQAQYPYFLHIYMSELLSDGRGANQPWLQGSPDPMTTMAWQTWVEIHPHTAAELGIEDGDVVRVSSPHGELEAPVYLYPAIRFDTVAIPTGQGHTDYGRYARDRGSNPLQLVGAETDDTGSSLVWSTVRVQITPTGEKAAMARFESREGVTEGFINQGFPGQ